MKFEKPQRGNPHNLTINQHVFPRAGINRFTDSDGMVQVFSRRLGRVIKIKSNNDFFCTKRTWDQRTEAGIGKQIEDEFQRLIDRIKVSNLQAIGVFEKQLVEEFFVLWRTRHKLKVEGLDDLVLSGIEGDSLTKDEQEILESKYVAFAVNGVMPGRFAAGIHLYGYTDAFVSSNRATQWGIVSAGEGEFIVPDSFQDMMIIPITPKVAIVADQPNSVLSRSEVAAVNQVAISRSTDYYFGRKLSMCPVLREEPPSINRRFAP